MQAKDSNYFVIQRSQLNTSKLFVEFYLPKYQILFEQLRQGKYPLLSLRQLSKRLFDGPFGSNRKVEMYQESGIFYIRVKDVLPDGINLNQLTYISEKKHKELTRSRVVPGNVLLTIAGRIGTVAVVPDSLKEGNITGHIAGIELPENINPYYLTTFLNSPLGQFQFTILGHRTTRPELNLREVGQVLVPVPPRPVQDRIAQVMQDAYTARSKHLIEAKQLYQEIDNYVLKELGINLANLQKKRSTVVPISFFIDKRFDFEAVVTTQEINLSFSEHELTSLGEVVTQINERITPLYKCPNERVNYIGLENIASNIGELVDYTLTKGSEILSSSPKFQQGDILFGRMRPYLNKVWVADFDGICSGEALVLRSDKQKVDTLFLQSLLLNRITLAQIVPLQSGSSLPRVSASDVLGIKLPIPKHLRRQTEIGAEVARRRTEAKRLRTEAETLVAEAKARVERMILGEEDGA